jgi:hypothetical protein
MKKKYIVIDDGLGEKIIVFPDCIAHQNVALAFHKVVSAGFIMFQSQPDVPEIEFKCYGKSVGLGLESRLDIDSAIASRQLNDEY